jgi:hypothetical protein
MEPVYEYLDKDVAKWLKENAPEPRHGQNYHQWLSGQYGLKKLVEHVWVPDWGFPNLPDDGRTSAKNGRTERETDGAVNASDSK